jgi:hypothetical protein
MKHTLKQYILLIIAPVIFLFFPRLFTSAMEQAAGRHTADISEITVVFTGDVGGYLRPCG